MAGIKETLEVIELVEKTADAIAAAKADGSIDWRDLAKLGPVVAQMKAAVEGGKLIPGEVKELDPAEIQQLLDATVGAVAKLIAAVIG